MKSLITMPPWYSSRKVIPGLPTLCLLLASFNIAVVNVAVAESPRIKVLFLGDNGHHRPADRAVPQLIPVMANRGIDVTYTEKLTDLEPANLRQYQCLLVYANHTKRLHFDDGQTEDHPPRNGEHFADYVRRVDVPGSQFAFALRSQQIRYLVVQPNRDAEIREIELVKGDEDSSPIVMAMTVETR